MQSPILLLLLLTLLAHVASPARPAPSKGFLNLPELLPSKIPFVYASPETVQKRRAANNGFFVDPRLVQARELNTTLPDGRGVEYRHFVHLQPNVVSLDFEESVTDVTCKGHVVTITGRSREDLAAWVVGSKLVFSGDWGCTFADTLVDDQSGSFLRTIISAKGPFPSRKGAEGELYVVELGTVAAAMGEVFQALKLRFNVTEPSAEERGEGGGRHRRSSFHASGSYNFNETTNLAIEEIPLPSPEGLEITCINCYIKVTASFSYDLEWSIFDGVTLYTTQVGGSSTLNMPIEVALADTNFRFEQDFGYVPIATFGFGLGPLSAASIEFALTLTTLVDLYLDNSGSVIFSQGFSFSFATGFQYEPSTGLVPLQDPPAFSSYFNVIPGDDFKSVGNLTLGLGPKIICTARLLTASVEADMALLFKLIVPLTVDLESENCNVGYSLNGGLDLNFHVGVLDFGVFDLSWDLEGLLPFRHTVPLIPQFPFKCAVCSGCLDFTVPTLPPVPPPTASPPTHLIFSQLTTVAGTTGFDVVGILPEFDLSATYAVGIHPGSNGTFTLTLNGITLSAEVTSEFQSILINPALFCTDPACASSLTLSDSVDGESYSAFMAPIVEILPGQLVSGTAADEDTVRIFSIPAFILDERTHVCFHFVLTGTGSMYLNAGLDFSTTTPFANNTSICTGSTPHTMVLTFPAGATDFSLHLTYEYGVDIGLSYQSVQICANCGVEVMMPRQTLSSADRLSFKFRTTGSVTFAHNNETLTNGTLPQTIDLADYHSGLTTTASAASDTVLEIIDLYAIKDVTADDSYAGALVAGDSIVYILPNTGYKQFSINLAVFAPDGSEVVTPVNVYVDAGAGNYPSFSGAAAHSLSVTSEQSLPFLTNDVLNVVVHCPFDANPPVANFTLSVTASTPICPADSTTGGASWPATEASTTQKGHCNDDSTGAPTRRCQENGVWSSTIGGTPCSDLSSNASSASSVFPGASAFLALALGLLACLWA